MDSQLMKEIALGDEAALDDYVHQPLDTSKQHIRLVKLHKSSHSEHANVFCEFATFEIESAPPYVALSYTWGESTPTRIIFVDDQCFEVRENLFEFLSAFQNDEANICYLWIDQLCIDQANPHERNHQVRLMSTIYQRCLYVIVWLDRSSYAAALQLSEAIREVSPHKAAFPSAEILLKNKYFNRLWIVQEVLLPRQVHILCGDVWISWGMLRSLIWNYPKWFLATHQINHTSVAWLFGSTGGEASRPSLWDQDRVPLSRCMILFAHMECADPRDKVYGILGLISEEDRPPVDYQKSLMAVILDVFMALSRVHWRSSVDGRTEEDSTYRLNIFMRIVGSLEWLRGLDLILYMFLEEICEIESWALMARVGSYDHSPITSIGLDEETSRSSVGDCYWFERNGQRHLRNLETSVARYEAKPMEKQSEIRKRGFKFIYTLV